MQVLLQGRSLDQGDIANAILKIVSNDQAMEVLRTTIEAPKSAWEISTITRIPLTQVYRWVRRLHKVGFVRVTGATNSAGKKYFMYQSKVGTIKVSLSAYPAMQVEIS